MANIERGHFTIAVAMLRRLAIRHPAEPLMTVGGEDLYGPALVRYLDSQSRVWLSDCPTPRQDGACGCFEEVRRG